MLRIGQDTAERKNAVSIARHARLLSGDGGWTPAVHAGDGGGEGGSAGGGWKGNGDGREGAGQSRRALHEYQGKDLDAAGKRVEEEDLRTT